MHKIVLVSPEIPGNIGAIMRTCACFGLPLHIVGPLPFVWDLQRVKREVMDYFEFLDLTMHDNFEEFQQSCERIIATSPTGSQLYSSFEYSKNDCVLFGCESKGLSQYILDRSDDTIRIPMICGRSLNLSVSVGIVASKIIEKSVK